MLRSRQMKPCGLTKCFLLFTASALRLRFANFVSICSSFFDRLATSFHVAALSYQLIVCI